MLFEKAITKPNKLHLLSKQITPFNKQQIAQLKVMNQILEMKQDEEKITFDEETDIIMHYKLNYATKIESYLNCEYSKKNIQILTLYHVGK